MLSPLQSGDSASAVGLEVKVVVRAHCCMAIPCCAC